ncbi:MAG: hypothetical protein NC113_00555 [Bacteroides sp.]|nr:hypothetical protein [Bacteroides sp.]MCM1446716.1 hypothetical protein [Bacteroides sp.]
MKEEKDKDLRQIFDDYRPKLKGEENFMEQLDRRLDAIEYVRQMQAKEQRRNRYATLCAFACGLVVGCILYAMLMAPDDALPSITVDTHFMLMRILTENQHLFVCMMLGTIAIAGIVMAVDMWKDAFDIKDIQDLGRAADKSSSARTSYDL